MPEVAVCDERGRITIGKEATDKLGRKFHVVVMPREIVLIPVSKDPLKELAAMGKKIPNHLKLEDLKKIAEEEAYKEAAGNWERLQKLNKKSRR
ncbi:MAG: AbrB/MazE/SpoVT family DNA-binding domain-containing protein [Candidatus Aenigmarchaeota archaeon]|nr:AbrB/MazE/SpoVT family DNA-binding domain-containing protein [Candidatus Aenigmarchaeota archaeon]